MRTTLESRERTNAACGLRYPVRSGGPSLQRCPPCLVRTKLVMNHPVSAPEHQTRKRSGKLHQVDALLVNGRSDVNVGSILRTAEGLGVHHAYLGGITPTPECPRVRKTSRGAEHSLSWSHDQNGLDLKSTLTAGISNPRVDSLKSCKRHEPSPIARKRSRPPLLVVGNEVARIDPAILDLTDDLLWIPVAGHEASLNVAAAFAIAAYGLMPRSDHPGKPRCSPPGRAHGPR